MQTVSVALSRPPRRDEAEMPDCCASGLQPQREPENCPRCGRKGRAIQEVTLKALLRSPALERHTEDKHRFCPEARCPVVYFGTTEIFMVEDVAAPVFQKEPPGERLICHCFDVTEKAIRKELEESGQSTAQKRITALVKGGRCACELRNPEGTCCLGNIAMAVQDMRGALNKTINK